MLIEAPPVLAPENIIPSADTVPHLTVVSLSRFYTSRGPFA